MGEETASNFHIIRRQLLWPKSTNRLRWRISLLWCTFLSYAGQFLFSARISLLHWRISRLHWRTSLLHCRSLSYTGELLSYTADLSPTLADFSPTLAKLLFQDLSCRAAKFLAEKRNMTVEVKSASIGGLYFSATVDNKRNITKQHYSAIPGHLF